MDHGRICRIALIGQDATIATSVLATVRAAGHECQHFPDGIAALDAIERDRFDLLLVAGTRPQAPVASLLAGVHALLGSALPVIGLSAAGDTDGAVAALEEGMDHILAGPVAPAVLLAQVNAALRRAGPPAGGIDAAVGHLVLRRDGMRVHVDGATVLVTAKEYELALLLCRNLGKLLSREHILQMVWGEGTPPSTRTLDVHLSRLRSKLLLRPDRGFRLSALYGRGYRLDYGPDAAEPRAPPPLTPPRPASPAGPAAGSHRPQAR